MDIGEKSFNVILLFIVEDGDLFVCSLSLLEIVVSYLEREELSSFLFVLKGVL